MKLAAIICEFNPLHTGHKLLIDYAKSVADKVVCIMSGNFTQRAMPACADKYSRARHAVAAGADIVVELPTVFATASAENFALGGVAIAQKLGADCLVFGSECGDLDKLRACAETMDGETTQKRIKEEIKKGVSYPKALALATNLPELDKPNNTLAIEYLRTANKLRADIVPLTIKREDNYNSDECDIYASSALLRNEPSLRAKYSYDFVVKDINDKAEKNYCQLVPSFLSVATVEQLREIEGISEGLENRIVKADKTQGYERLLQELKTKRYTRLKLQRVILNTILKIRKTDVAHAKNGAPLMKVLAVKRNALFLMSQIENKSDEITERADSLYGSITGEKAPRLLPVFDD